MPVAKIYVTLKKSVLDPQGVTVKKALESMGYKGIEDLRIGKYIEMKFEGLNRETIEQMCDRLLANPIIENYWFELEECNEIG